MQTNVVTISAVEEESLANLRDVFTKNTANLIFRRVGRVVAKDSDLIHTIVKTAESSKVIPKDEKFVASEQEWLQNVEQVYSKFYFFTTTTSLRENDRWGPIGIYGVSNKYAEIDVVDSMNFRFRPRFSTQTPPREGDLVCGLVTKPVPGRTNPEFKSWFICSEQFFHAWTSIIYKDHESISKDFDDDAKIRRYLMSGNRLCTNSFLKWKLACEQSMVDSNKDELEKRFYRLRTESISKRWVHVYAALVLILRYKELPSKDNVPNNLDKGPKMTQWSLPDGWVERLVKVYGITVTQEQRENIPNTRQMIPKGTHVSITIDSQKSVEIEVVDESKDEDKPSTPTQVQKLHIDDMNEFPTLEASTV